jgi:hypothetical protein
MGLRYPYTPQRQWLIASLAQSAYGPGFLRRAVPEVAIDPGGPFPWVFSHPFDGKSFAAQRMGQQML